MNELYHQLPFSIDTIYINKSGALAHIQTATPLHNTHTRKKNPNKNHTLAKVQPNRWCGLWRFFHPSNNFVIPVRRMSFSLTTLVFCTLFYMLCIHYVQVQCARLFRLDYSATWHRIYIICTYVWVKFFFYLAFFCMCVRQILEKRRLF